MHTTQLTYNLQFIPKYMLRGSSFKKVKVETCTQTTQTS